MALIQVIAVSKLSKTGSKLLIIEFETPWRKTFTDSWKLLSNDFQPFHELSNIFQHNYWYHTLERLGKTPTRVFHRWLKGSWRGWGTPTEKIFVETEREKFFPFQTRRSETSISNQWADKFSEPGHLLVPRNPRLKIQFISAILNF